VSRVVHGATVPRRELLRRGAAAAGGALALPLAAGAPRAAAASIRDREVLEEALGLERRLASLYEQVARAGGRLAQEAEPFGRDCEQHARGLGISIANRGGRPSTEGGAPSPASPGGAAALELETEAIATYYRAHADFGDQAFLPTLTSIMANHGQHLALLRRRLGQEPATLAFETGGVE
jgi:hypothetical protein